MRNFPASIRTNFIPIGFLPTSVLNCDATTAKRPTSNTLAANDSQNQRGRLTGPWENVSPDSTGPGFTVSMGPSASLIVLRLCVAGDANSSSSVGWVATAAEETVPADAQTDPGPGCPIGPSVWPGSDWETSACDASGHSLPVLKNGFSACATAFGAW